MSVVSEITGHLSRVGRVYGPCVGEHTVLGCVHSSTGICICIHSVVGRAY